MKGKYLLLSLLSFLFVNFAANAQTLPIPASQDTVWITGGSDNPGVLETIISGDTANGGRVNKNRVYGLLKDQIYIQNSAFTFSDANATLHIVGQAGGNKPIVLMDEVNGVQQGQNQIIGSIHIDNVYWIGMDLAGNILNDPFTTSTANGLRQSCIVNNSVFEFANIDWFNTDAWVNGATLKFTNCYFRDLFNGSQWWAGRVFYMKHYTDSIWVENCAVTNGGLIFLTQYSLVAFNYYNHNTIINSNKYWQLGQNFLEGYWTNNLFLNENWVGEDSANIASGQDQDGEFFGTINLDTLWVNKGKLKNAIFVPAKYMNADSTLNQDLLGLDKQKIFVADNMHYTDTTLLDPFYFNYHQAYDTSYVNSPASYVNWGGVPIAPVQNIPCIWMNWRTQGFFNHYPNFVQRDNIFTPFNTVRPAIMSANTVVLMGQWDEAQYSNPAFSGATTGAALTASDYEFGDYSAATLPGYDASGNKTETGGSGIAKVSDFIENLNQAGTVQLSKIDGLPIGCLLFDAAKNDAYMKADPLARLTAVKAAYGTTGVKKENNSVPTSYKLSQNYPNPFNPTTNISYSIPVSGSVSLKIFNILGQEVATVFQGFQKAGSYKADFDASKLASGVYLYRLDAGQFSETKKMMLLK